jgi:hypothetical protein
VGDKDFVSRTQKKLGARAVGRKAVEADDGYELRDPQKPYRNVLVPKKVALRQENRYVWDISNVISK